MERTNPARAVATSAEKAGGALRRLSRNDPAVSAVVHAWRRLTGGGRTLVACSGGADSCALAIALSTAGAEVVVAHVRHDMRAEAETLEDECFVKAFAGSMGVPFVAKSVAVQAEGGNAEAAARRLRYAALAEMAALHGVSFVATGHHAGDQFESVLMSLLRGAGPAGLSGIAQSRPVAAGGPMLVRPMLGVTRADAQRLCTDAGVAWRNDTTNDDTARLRAALRAGVIPELERLRPGAALRAASSAELLAGAAEVVQQRAEAVFGDGFDWDRSTLRSEPAVVVGHGLRAAVLRLTDGKGADTLSSRRIGQAVRAVCDSQTSPRVFDWPEGLVLRVTAHGVRLGVEGEPAA